MTDPAERSTERTAAETTARNTTILVWALVGLPVVALALWLIALFGNWALGELMKPVHEKNYQAVVDTYQTVGYSPPGGGFGQQIMQTCQYLQAGFDQQTAATVIVGATPDQARQIVASIADNQC